MVPQPACDGIVYPEWKYYPDGAVEPVGFAQALLRYEALPEDELAELLTQCGLSDSVSSVEVTLRLPNLARTFSNFNARIARFQDVKYRYWYTGLVLEARRLQAI